MKKRLLSVLMCLSMVLSLLPAVTPPAAATTTDRSVMLGSTALATDGSGYLYYGRNSDATPLLWRVLSNTPSDYQSYTDDTGKAYSEGDGYNLAVSLDSILQARDIHTYTTFFTRSTDVIGDTYTYENSDLRTSLNTFQSAALTTAEQGYLLPTTIVTTHKGGANTEGGIAGDKSTQTVVVPDQKVFEIGAVPAFEQNNTSVSYWLRNTNHDYGPTLLAEAWAKSSSTGTYSTMDQSSSWPDNMRPSANLDAKIGMLTSLDGKSAVTAAGTAATPTATALYSDGEWVPTMTDSAKTGFTASLSSATAGRDTNITITYSGAYTQSGDLMVLLLQDGAVRQTARIATTSESGTATLNTGSIVGGYEVKIFAESCPANDVAVMSNVADAGTLTVNVSTDAAVTDSVNAINAMTALTVTQATFEGNQQQAVADALNAWLLENVNEGASVAAADVAISHVAPAQAGTSGTPAGVNGEVTFTPTVTKGVSSQAANSLTWIVTATPHTGTTDAQDVASAVTAVSALDFSTYQSEGNTEEELRALIAQKINAAISGYGISVLTSQITRNSFTPATAGTSSAPAGTNGSFGFTVTLAKGSASQYVSGLTAKITATPYAAAGGQGTAESPYILTTAADLQLLAAYPDKCFKLGANITITQADGTFWTPLGNFSGTLDGDGYSISGLKLGVSSTALASGGIKRVTNQGFFNSLTSTATVKNLTFASPELPLNGARNIISYTGEQMRYMDAGGFLADSSAGTIENCRVENAAVNLMSDLGDSNSNNGAGGLEHFGGLVNINTGTVRNCAVDGITIIVPAYKTNNFDLYSTSSDHYPQVKAIGGMIGENNGTVSGCTVTGLFMPSPEFWCKSGSYISTNTTLTIGFPNQSMSGIPPMLGIGGLIGYQDGACTSDKVSNLYVSCTMKTLKYGSTTGSPYYLAFNGFGYYEKNISTASNYLYAYTTNGAVIGYVQTRGSATYVSIPDTISAGVTDSTTTAAEAHHSYLAGGFVHDSYDTGVHAEYSHSKAWDGTASGTNTWTVVLKNGDTVLSSYSVTKGEKLTLPKTRLSSGLTVTKWAHGTTTYDAGNSIDVASDLTLTVSATADSTSLYAVNTDTTAEGVKQTTAAGYAPVFSSTGTAPDANTYALSYRLTDRNDLVWATTTPTNAGVYDVKISPIDPSLWTATVYTVTGGLTLTGHVPAGRITIASANATRTFSNQAQTVTADQLDFDHTGIAAKDISNIRYKSSTAEATTTAPTQPGTYTVLVDIATVEPFTATPDYSLGTLTILTAAQSALTKNVFLNYSNTAQQTVSIASLLPAGISGASYYAGYPTYSKTTLFAVRPTCSASGVVSYQLASGLKAENVGQTATIPVTVTSSNYSQFTVKVVVSIADHDDCSDSITFADGSKPYNGAEQTYEAATIPSSFTGGSFTYTYAVDGSVAENAAWLNINKRPVGTGSYLVTATYINTGYTGSKTAKLTITKANNTLTNKTDGGYSTQTYGSVLEPTASQFSAVYPITSISTEWYQGGKKLESKPVNVGTYTARVTAAETRDANAASVDVTFSVVQAPLTVTASAQSIPYAGSLSQGASNVTAAGLVNGDTVDSVTLSTANTDVTKAGTITAKDAVIKNGTADVTANYTIAYAPGTLTITKSTPGISISDAYTGKTYDGTPMTVPTEAQLTVTGAPKSDVTFIWLEGSRDNAISSAPTNVGTYRVRASVADTVNHGAASADKTFTITAKSITPTVTLSQDSYTYSNSACEPTVTVKDDETTLTKDTDYTVAYSNNLLAGIATVTVKAKTGGNYSFTDVTKTFVINSASVDLTVTPKSDSVAYGKNVEINVSAPTANLKGATMELYCGGVLLATATGVTYSNTTTITYLTTKKHLSIGTNLFTVKITDGSAAGSVATTRVTITQAPLTVYSSSLVAVDREYSPNIYTVSSVRASDGPLFLGDYAGDDIDLDLTRVQGTVSDNTVGAHTATFTNFVLTGADASYYSLDSTSKVTASVSITQKKVTPTVTVDPTTIVYKSANPSVTVKDGDYVIPESEYNPPVYSGVNVGTQTATVTNASGGNYIINEAYASYTVTNAAQPNALTLVGQYGGNEIALTDSDTYKYGDRITLQASSTGAPADASTTFEIISGSACVTATLSGLNSENISFNGTETGIVTVKATRTATNYDPISTTYTFTTIKSTPTINSVRVQSPTTVYTNTPLSSIVLTGQAQYGPVIEGTFSLDAGQTLTAGTNSYKYTFTPDNTAGYNSVSGTISIPVTQYALSSINYSVVATIPTTFYYGDRFPVSNLTFTAYYTDNTSADVTDKVQMAYPKSGSFFQAGDTKVTFSYTENGKEVTKDYTLQSAVNKKRIDISDIYFTNTTQTFDGRVKSVYLNKPIPEGLTCTITGNSATNAGGYTAKATFALMDGYSSDDYVIYSNSSEKASPFEQLWPWRIGIAAAPDISDQEFSYLRTDTTTPRTVSLAGLLPANCGTATWSISDSTYTNLNNLTEVSINSTNGTLSYTTNQTDTDVTDTIYVYVSTTNYALTAIHVKVNLTDKYPVAVDLSGIALSDKPYDGTALSYTGNATGTYTSDTYRGGFTYEWYQGENKVAAPTKAGTYALIATVTDTANFIGSAQKTVTISPRTAELSWANTEFTYDGTAKKPTATVTNPVGSETVTVTVTGGQTHAGKYRATAASLSNANYQLPEVNTVSYIINKAESSIALTPVTATYGSQATFAVTAPADATGTVLFYGNGTLLGQANFSGGSASINYNIVGGPFTAGSNTITAAYAGDNNYNAATASATFTLAPKSISGAAIDAIADQTFTGSPVTPAVTVKDGSATLVSGTDYTVSYSSNTNAGTATVTVSGTGHYTGTVQKAFTITPKASGSANAAVSVVYSDTAAKTVSLADVLKAFKAGSETLTFSNVQYAGSDLAAAPTVDAGGVLSFALKSGLKSGGTTETVTVDVAGLTNYTKVTVTVTISLTNPAPAGGSSTDTGTKVTIPVSSNEGDVKVEATVKDGTAAVTITDAQIAEIASGKSDTGTVKMDVSSLDVSAATVPAKVIAAADSSASATGVEVALPTGTVTLDKTALAAVSEKGGDVTISVDKVDNAKLTETQKEVLGSQAETALVVDVTVLASGQKVSAFGGGSIGVAVSYTPKANEDTSKLVVWFINDDGTIEPKTGFYNAKTGKYEFQTQHLSQYVLVSFPFKDVAADSWYYGNVAYAYMNGLFAGTGETTFSPAETMTRGMLVTVLYRMEDSPAVTAGSSFTDVAADAYYAKAVAWASANKLVTGYDAATFAPDDTVTREQLAAILCRYAQFKGYDVSKTAELTAFADASSASAWATDALRWATGAGLINGSDGKLLPQNGAQRAQVAAILQRYVRNAA